MAISKKKFEKYDVPVPFKRGRLISFFENNKDKAFTILELMEELNTTNYNSMGTLLNDLKNRGIIEHKKPYWIYKQGVKKNGKNKD